MARRGSPHTDLGFPLRSRQSDSSNTFLACPPQGEVGLSLAPGGYFLSGFSLLSSPHSLWPRSRQPDPPRPVEDVCPPVPGGHSYRPPPFTPPLPAVVYRRCHGYGAARQRGHVTAAGPTDSATLTEGAWVRGRGYPGEAWPREGACPGVAKGRLLGAVAGGVGRWWQCWGETCPGSHPLWCLRPLGWSLELPWSLYRASDNNNNEHFGPGHRRPPLHAVQASASGLSAFCSNNI